MVKKSKPPVVYASVPRLWEHHPAVCVVLGSGPSLTKDDVRYAQAHADGLIAVNDSYLFAPNATALYAADDKWWKWHHGCTADHTMPNGKRYPPFMGAFKYTLGRTAFPDVGILRKGPETGLSDDPGAVALGRNGVYQAINVAIHFGATRIVLLGVDMQDSNRHFFGRHIDNSGPPVSFCIERFATMVKPLKARGIDVINSTRTTALKCFPCVPLEHALPAIERIAV